MPNFHYESELFEDVFSTSPKLPNQQTEEDKIRYVQNLIHGEPCRMFRDLSRLKRNNFAQNLVELCTSHTKLHSKAASGHKC